MKKGENMSVNFLHSSLESFNVRFHQNGRIMEEGCKERYAVQYDQY